MYRHLIISEGRIISEQKRIISEGRIISEQKRIVSRESYRQVNQLTLIEKIKRTFTGKSYRQVDHLTSTDHSKPTFDTSFRYNCTISDDLESFCEGIRLGRNPSQESIAWTYSVSALTTPILSLTEEEINYVDHKGKKYIQTSKSLKNANVDMRTRIYVTAYCRRKTISIESEFFQRRGRGQRRFVWQDEEEEIQYGSTDNTIALIKLQQPFYPLLGNAYQS